MKHDQLAGAGVKPHHEIDRLLSALEGDRSLPGDLVLGLGVKVKHA